MSSTIGERIKTLREGLGWSQEDLASRAGVTRGAISQWETTPTQRILAPHLVATAKALGVTVDELVTGKPGCREEPADYAVPAVPDMLVAAWPHLTSAQRDSLARQAAELAARNTEILRELGK